VANGIAKEFSVTGFVYKFEVSEELRTFQLLESLFGLRFLTFSCRSGDLRFLAVLCIGTCVYNNWGVEGRTLKAYYCFLRGIQIVIATPLSGWKYL